MDFFDQLDPRTATPMEQVSGEKGELCWERNLIWSYSLRVSWSVYELSSWLSDIYIYIYIYIIYIIYIYIYIYIYILYIYTYIIYIYIYIYIAYIYSRQENLVIRNNSSPSIGVLQKTNVIYKFKCPLGDCISDNNNIYVGLTSTTLSRRLTMHLSDTSSIAQHLKKHSCPTAQLRKILTDNTTILEHQNNKQKLQILEALHIRNLQPTLNRINFQTSANVLKCL